MNRKKVIKILSSMSYAYCEKTEQTCVMMEEKLVSRIVSFPEGQKRE
jgi:hypothetical protein